MLNTERGSVCINSPLQQRKRTVGNQGSVAVRTRKPDERSRSIVAGPKTDCVLESADPSIFFPVVKKPAPHYIK